MRRLIVPVSFAVMALAVAAMLPALVSAHTVERPIRHCFGTFSHNIGVGSDRADDISRLSLALWAEGVLEGKTNVFTDDVAAAVVTFQMKYGIPTTGYVGPLTRAKLNVLYGCGLGEDGSSVAAVCPQGYMCTSAHHLSRDVCVSGDPCTLVSDSRGVIVSRPQYLFPHTENRGDGYLTGHGYLRQWNALGPPRVDGGYS